MQSQSELQMKMKIEMEMEKMKLKLEMATICSTAQPAGHLTCNKTTQKRNETQQQQNFVQAATMAMKSLHREREWEAALKRERKWEA